MKIEICKNCEDAITFSSTRKKRRIALNPDPVPGGEYIVSDGSNYLGEIITNVSPINLGYVAHSKTCPKARKLRKRDRVKPEKVS